MTRRLGLRRSHFRHDGLNAVTEFDFGGVENGVLPFGLELFFAGAHFQDHGPVNLETMDSRNRNQFEA